MYSEIINEAKIGLFFLLLETLLTSCHVYYKGFLINNTRDTIMVTTKPSVLIYEKDLNYEELLKKNLEDNDSIFRGLIMPHDSLLFNSGPSYSTSLSLIQYLKIQRKNDSIIFVSQKSIRENVKVFTRRYNKVNIGIIITDSRLSPLLS